MAHRKRVNVRALWRSYAAPAIERATIERFQRLYYGRHTTGGTWRDTFWLGVPTMKCPLDLWLYQEIIHATKPDVIVETGTAFGGSALYLAGVCALAGRGKVVTVDLDPRPNRPKHDRLICVTGSSTDPETVARVKEHIPDGGAVMVILDSDHAKRHVLAELHTYGGMVSPGCYLIVEDTILNGHPVVPDHGPGPMEAMEEYLKIDRSFLTDARMGKFLMTFNVRGYLRKIDL